MNGDGRLRWLVGGLTVATIYVCWPLWPALVLAAWTAALARPLLLRLEKRLPERRAASALTLALFLVLALPFGLVIVGTISGAQQILASVTAASSAKGALEAIATGDSVLAMPRSLPDLVALLERYGAPGYGVLTKVADVATETLVLVLIYFGGAFAFLLDGPAIWAWMQRHSPLEPKHLARMRAAFHETGRGLLVGVGLTTATQGLVATLVYLSLGVPRWWVLGPITGIASMIPLIGSALVWGPIAAGLFLTGQTVKAVVLVGLGVGVISVVDNVMRPIFARFGALSMPTFLLFVSLFGGLAAFGASGAILGPLVVRLWLEALALREPAAIERPPSSISAPPSP